MAEADELLPGVVDAFESAEALDERDAEAGGDEGDRRGGRALQAARDAVADLRADTLALALGLAGGLLYVVGYLVERPLERGIIQFEVADECAEVERDKPPPPRLFRRWLVLLREQFAAQPALSR